MLLLDIKERYVDRSTVKVVKPCVWSPSLDDDLFFNIDGSARGCLGMASIRGVLRDAYGKIFCLFSSGIGVSDSTSAEVHTILRAFNLIFTNRLFANRNISITSNSKAIVSWANGEGFGRLNLVKEIYENRLFLQTMNYFSIKFMPRGTNSLSNSLAKAGTSLQEERPNPGGLGYRFLVFSFCPVFGAGFCPLCFWFCLLLFGFCVLVF